MSERFVWVSDVARGEWLRPMEAEPVGSILSIVPRGFEAYARVFHAVERDRPRDTKTWMGVDEATSFDGVADMAAMLETERATWGQAALSFGTAMHSQAQFPRLVRRDYGSADGAISADGWRYGDTSEGCFDAVSLTTAAAVLARHTTTPDAGVAAVWDGWGGLVSSAGAAYLETGWIEGIPARYTDDPSLGDRIAAAARAGIAGARSMFEALPGLGRAEPEPGSGLLAREIAAGPRFDLQGDTGRCYVLFEAGANDFADASWPDKAPWVNETMWAQSPSILWPDDHSWVLATEIGFDSTLVAGTRALIRELVQTPGLEVLSIRPDADLSWDGDVPNRPE